ncbi:zinc-finger domain-containing protein [Jezberella montanilacus]
MVGSEDLPLHCPTNSTPVWDMHPRVFLDIVDTGSAQCPYCGAKYQLKPGVSAGHGH